MKLRKELRIAYANFWGKADLRGSHFELALKDDYDCRVVGPDDSPDLLIYSCGTVYNPLRSNAKARIFYSGENVFPDFNQCDYALTFHHLELGDRHMRLPNYCLYDEFEQMCRGRRMDVDTTPSGRDFCSIVVSVSHYAAPMRARLFDALSAYKPVASGGKWRNNVGGRVADKNGFISRYKFNLAIENSQLPGYTTEKILQAFYSRTVPIYWGDPLVARDFNPASFINVNDFPTLEEAVDYIKKVDKDDALYQSYLDANPLEGNPMIGYMDRLRAFLLTAIESGRQVEDHGWIKMHNKWQSRLNDVRAAVDKVKKWL